MENKNTMNVQTTTENEIALHVITVKTTFGELLNMLGLTVGQKKEGKTPKRATLLAESGTPIVENQYIKVFHNGYALYESGYGKYSVLWLPYCTHFTYHFNKLRDTEKDYLKENDNLPDGMLELTKWSAVIALFGEERITQKLNRGFGSCDAAENDADSEEKYEEAKDEDEIGEYFDWYDEPLGVDPLLAVIRREAREKMLAILTDKQREVFVLYYKYGVSQREIAEYLGINQKAVSDRLKYAMKKLQNYFS